MYIGPNRLQAIAYDMLGLNVIDPITVEYLSKYNKKKDVEEPEARKESDEKDDLEETERNPELYKQKYYRVVKVFLEAIQADLKLFDSVNDEKIQSSVDQRRISLRRYERTCVDILNKKSLGKSSVSSPSPAQSQLRAQRERDLKGNPLVYKAWKRATPSLQDDCDDAW